MNCVSRVFLSRKIRGYRHLGFYYSGMIILLFISMQMAGCGAEKISPYHANALNTYSNQAAKNDLHIAIQPMTDKEEQEKYFGVALTDVGILPVYVIAENRSASHRFMLRDDRISLRNKITNRSYPKPLQTDAADDSHLEGAKRTSLIAGNVLLSAPLLFTSLGLARNSERVKVIQDSMFDKTLYTQTISPGKTAGGFAYFKIVDGKIDVSTATDRMRELVLAIQVTDEQALSDCDFQFDLP
jgi:hypothetical protein